MTKKFYEFAFKIIKLLEEDLGQAVKDLARKLNVNRTFLDGAGYLRTLEDQGYVRSKRVGPVRIYFKTGLGG